MLWKWKSRTWYSSILLICLLIVRVERHQGWGDAAASIETVSLLTALSGELEASSKKRNKVDETKHTMRENRYGVSREKKMTGGESGNSFTGDVTSKQSQYVSQWWGNAIWGWRNCINKDTVQRLCTTNAFFSFSRDRVWRARKEAELLEAFDVRGGGPSMWDEGVSPRGAVCQSTG